MLTLTPFEKNKIRTALLLELNNCFSRVSKHYEEYGSNGDREFLQKLISSIRSCIEADPSAAVAKKNSRSTKS